MSAKKRPDPDTLANELGSSSAFFPTKPTSTQTDKPTSTQDPLPTSTQQFVKYTTHLPPALIKKIKVYASLHDMKDYEVATEAFVMYFLMHGEEDKPKVE